MAHKISMLAGALAAALVAQSVSAELYISPVLRHNVAPAPVAAPVPVAAPAPANVAPVAAQPSPSAVEAAKRVAQAKAEAVPVKPAEKIEKKAPDLFGKDVPVKAAMAQLVPRDWTVTYEPGVENIKVSWRDADGWRAAVDQIGGNSSLNIHKNDAVKHIGVARSLSMASDLAKPGYLVWDLKKGVSLRSNLDQWAQRAGWKVDWSQTDADYPNEHGAQLVGPFTGAGGVVDRLLSATSHRDVPLIAKFYTQNRVVVILEDGYQPEKALRPAVDDSN